MLIPTKTAKTLAITLGTTVSTLLFNPASHAGALQLGAIEEAFHTQDMPKLETFSQELEGFDQFIAQYRLANHLVITQKIEQAKVVLEELVTALEKYTEQTPEDAQVQALLANVYGFSIAVTPNKAGTYGQYSQTRMKKAMRAAPEDALVLFLQSTLDYNTPTAFGGSKVKAQAALTKALAAYPEAVNSERYWGHADALVLMGLTHLEQGDKNTAHHYWQKALNVAPSHAWATFLMTQHTL